MADCGIARAENKKYRKADLNLKLYITNRNCVRYGQLKMLLMCWWHLQWEISAVSVLMLFMHNWCAVIWDAKGDCYGTRVTCSSFHCCRSHHQYYRHKGILHNNRFMCRNL